MMLGHIWHSVTAGSLHLVFTFSTTNWLVHNNLKVLLGSYFCPRLAALNMIFDVLSNAICWESIRNCFHNKQISVGKKKKMDSYPYVFEFCSKFAWLVFAQSLGVQLPSSKSRNVWIWPVTWRPRASVGSCSVCWVTVLQTACRKLRWESVVILLLLEKWLRTGWCDVAW